MDLLENIEVNVVRCDFCGVFDSFMWYKYDIEIVLFDEIFCGDFVDDLKLVLKFVVNDERRLEG